MKPLILAALSALTILLLITSQKPPGKTTPPTLQKPLKPRPSPHFWQSAHIPDPENHHPTPPIRPRDLGVKTPTTPTDHPTRITRAISQQDLPTIQSATLSWYSQDPTAARNWLASQPTLTDLQPAISYIALKITDQGDLTTAIQWATLLSEDTLREDTLLHIHALALQNGQTTLSEIDLSPIPPHRRAEILSGAAGD